MMTGSILDILIYVFDRYMLADAPDVPQREHLARDLERAGFTPAKVERALDWLTDLAFGRDRPPLPAAAPAGPPPGGVLLSSAGAPPRLSTECRGFLLTLERLDVLSPQQRELVIERMLGIAADEPDTEQLQGAGVM